MLTLEEFQKNVLDKNGSLQRAIAVNYDNDFQFYIVSKGGMGNPITAKIKKYSPEIRLCVLSMVASGVLIRNDKPRLPLDSNRLVYFLSPTKKNKHEKAGNNLNQRALLEIISTLWGNTPQLQLMQLLMNAIHPSKSYPEIFHIDDEQLITKLSALLPQQEPAAIPLIDNDDLLKLYNAIYDCFEDSDSAVIWMHTTIVELDVQTPTYLMRTSRGRADLKTFIEQIPHAGPSNISNKHPTVGE